MKKEHIRPPEQQQKSKSIPSETKVEKDKRFGYREIFDQALALALEKNISGALEKITALLDNYLPFAKAYLLKSGVLINLKKLDDANDAAKKALEMDKICIEAYILQGG